MPYKLDSGEVKRGKLRANQIEIAASNPWV